MKARIIAVLLMAVFSAGRSGGQKIEPFVKGGLTIGLFDGTAVSNDDVGHTGLNLGAGIRWSLGKSGKSFLEPSINLISKGNVYKVRQADGRVTFSLLYVETQLDWIYRWPLGKDWYVPLGTGLYAAYGLNSHVKATNGVAWYRGVHVGESNSMFDNSIGAHRWDAGWRVWTVGLEYRRLLFRTDFELGFFSLFNGKKPYRLQENHMGGTWAMSLSLGYHL